MKINDKLSILSFLSRKRRSKDGTAPIYVRLTITGTDDLCEFPIGKKCHVDHWNVEHKLVDDNSPEAKAANSYLKKVHSELEKLYLLMEMNNDRLTAAVQDYIRQFEEARPDFAQDANAEIDFYKNLSPRLFAHLIYYIRIYRLESALPVGSRHGKRKLIKEEQKEIENYFLDNESAYRYFKSQDSGLDEELFRRKSHLLPHYIDESAWLTDPNLCTPTGLKLARFIAYEKLQEYLTDTASKYMPASSKAAPKFTWTSNKVDLVELTYALCYSRAVNNGKLAVKELAQFFANTFDIDLSNIY